MAAKKPERPAGVAGDRFVVQLKGNWYYIIDAKTRLIAGGPYNTRWEAQEKADALERTKGR
jgi:hypothetical protein